MIDRKYTELLLSFLEKRFNPRNLGNVAMDVPPREASPGYKSEKEVEWSHLGVKCRTNFYSEEGKLYFYFEMEYNDRPGLEGKIATKSFSSDFIDKSSTVLSRPNREIQESGTHAEIRHYNVSCRMKKNIKNLNPKKNSEDAERIIKEVWDYLIKMPYGVATGMVK